YAYPVSGVCELIGMPLASNDAASGRMHPASFRSHQRTPKRSCWRRSRALFRSGDRCKCTASVAFWSAPPMSFDPDKPFHDGDAPTIDKAIASSVIADYVSGKLQTLAEHFQTAEPNQFAYLYNKWGESKLPVEDVPGFTDRKDKQNPIKLRSFGTLESVGKKTLLGDATFEAAVHETIHLNSNL